MNKKKSKTTLEIFINRNKLNNAGWLDVLGILFSNNQFFLYLRNQDLLNSFSKKSTFSLVKLFISLDIFLVL